MERWALASLTALEVDARDRTVRGCYAARDNDLDAVIAACRAVEADPEIPRSVADRARDVGLTSTKLAAFRRYVGASPHEYVLRWRLAVAAELIDSGRRERDLLRGFENLSHFCRTFQRTSAYVRRPGARSPRGGAENRGPDRGVWSRARVAPARRRGATTCAPSDRSSGRRPRSRVPSACAAPGCRR